MSWDKENFEILRFFFFTAPKLSLSYNTDTSVSPHLYQMVFVCVNIFWFGLTHERSFTLFFCILVAVVFNLASLLLLLPLLLPDGPGREVSQQLCCSHFTGVKADRAIAGGDKGWPTWTHNHTILTLRTGGNFPYLHLFLPIIQCYFLIQCYFVVMTGGP